MFKGPLSPKAKSYMHYLSNWNYGYTALCKPTKRLEIPISLDVFDQNYITREDQPPRETQLKTFYLRWFPLQKAVPDFVDYEYKGSWYVEDGDKTLQLKNTVKEYLESKIINYVKQEKTIKAWKVSQKLSQWNNSKFMGV